MRDPPQGTPSTRCSSPSLPGAPLRRSVPPGRRGAGFGPAPSPPPSSSPHEGDVIQRAAGAGAIHAARLVVIPAGSKGTGWGGLQPGSTVPGGGITPWVPTGSPGAGAGTRSSQPCYTQPRAGSTGGAGHAATGSSGLAGNVAPGWETGPRGTGTPQRPPRLAPGPLHVPLVPSMPPPGCCLGE